MNQLKQSSQKRLNTFNNIEEKIMNIAEFTFVLDIIIGVVISLIGLAILLSGEGIWCLSIGISVMASAITTYPLFGLGGLIKTQKEICLAITTSSTDEVTQTFTAYNTPEDENLPEL